MVPTLAGQWIAFGGKSRGRRLTSSVATLFATDYNELAPSRRPLGEALGDGDDVLVKGLRRTRYANIPTSTHK